MLDIRWIRQFPDDFDVALRKRGLSPLAATILELDQSYVAALRHTQDLQTERNTVAREIAAAKQAKQSADALMERGSTIRQILEEQEKNVHVLKKQIEDLLIPLPNIPANDVPEGLDETANQEVRKWGTPSVFSFTPQPHEVLGPPLGMDFEAASRMSGSRFVLLKGPLARLERALATFMLDTHTGVFGYTEVSPPYLVRDEAAYGVGQLPKFQEDLFQTTDNRWLISTAEVSLTNIVREQNLKEDQLPLRYVAYTPCFRSEAGSAGRDTHGMIRLHQFSKVELVHITTPEQAAQEHAFLLNAAEEILKKLHLPYRVMLLSSGDMGSASSKTYDLEVWLPGQNAYREISSCSNCRDYQARRMNTRFHDSEGGLAFVHTLNGSGLAVGRTLVAVLENYQQADGSLLIPEALQPYMGGQTHLGSFAK